MGKQWKGESANRGQTPAATRDGYVPHGRHDMAYLLHMLVLVDAVPKEKHPDNVAHLRHHGYLVKIALLHVVTRPRSAYSCQRRLEERQQDEGVGRAREGDCVCVCGAVCVWGRGGLARMQ